MAAEEIVLKTQTLTEFLQVVERWKTQWNVGERAIYRGHTDSNWILIAKLFRDPNSKPENKDSDDPKGIEEQLIDEHLPMNVAHNIEHRLFNDFSRYLYAFRPDLVCTIPEEEKSSSIRSIQEWRQLAIAQHYGLPTRFLDFTTNMLVALFFAIEEPAAYRKTTKGEWLEQDSSVWCIEVPNRLKVWQVWNRDDHWLSPLEFAEKGSDPPIAVFENTAFVPEHIDGRIRAQGSVFMCESRGKNKDWQLHVRLRDKTKFVIDRKTNLQKETRTLKICIPANFRCSLQEQLDSMGINRATLFPDLEGAAVYLRWAVCQRKMTYLR